MKEFSSLILKIFFTDFLILLSVFVFIFLCFLITNKIRNKNKALTLDNIFIYSLKNFPLLIGGKIKNIIRWALILFLVHLTVNVITYLSDYIKESSTYENAPLLAFVVDVFSSLIPVFKPFIAPSIIILIAVLLGYGVYATIYDLYKNQTKMEQLKSIIKPEDKDNATPTVYKASKKEIAVYFTDNVQKCFFNILKFLPKILIVALFCLMINAVFVNVKNVMKIVDNQKKISELNLTIKNLSNKECVTRITLLSEIDTPTSYLPLKTYKIEVLNNDGSVIEEETQEVTLKGNEIYIDFININFDYSKISLGESYNIAYPYRVYSESTIPSKGTVLTAFSLTDSKNYPVIYALEKDEIYGLEQNVYYNSLKEIFDVIKDSDLSREKGIRSVIGSAHHFNMQEGDSYDIFIEGTGGISILSHETL